MARLGVFYIGLFRLLVKRLVAKWQHWYRFFWGVLLLLVSGVVAAEMSIYTARDPGNILISKLDDKVKFTLTVDFKPHQTRGPKSRKFLTYRFGIADSDIVSSGGHSNPGDTLPVTELSKYLEPEITFHQGQSTPSSKKFNLGSFSHDYQKNGGFDPDTTKDAFQLTGTFDIQFDAHKVRSQLDIDPNFKLDIWIIGQETSGGFGQSVDSQLASVTIKKKVNIQVSQLKDFALTQLNKVGNYYQHTKSFCIYVSENPYRYWVTLTDQNTGGTGALKMKSNAGQELNYQVGFASEASLLNSGSYMSKMPDYLGPFVGSKDLNCASGPSPVISIRLLSTEADSKPDGIYRDTITVYVEPE